MASRVDHLKSKWGIDSNRRIVAILLTFTFAGLAITQCRPLVFALFRFTDETPFAIKTITYLLLIFPLYQILLMLFGTLLGEFRFFWAKEKAMLKWFGRRLGLVSPETSPRRG